MKKILISLALLLSVSSVQAADADWKSWYSNMLKGLRSKIEKGMESKTRVTAVAAVRGAKQGSDPKALYWKGGISDAARKKLEAERKQLGDAVQLVLDGDVAGGSAALNKFIKDNPDSVMLQDAKDALAKLPAADAKAAPPAQTAPAAQAAEPAKQDAPVEKQEKPAADTVVKPGN